MTTVRCPRCHREAPELTAFCAGCGAPLLLRDDEPAGPVGATVDLDRRKPVLAVELPGPAATFPPAGRNVARNVVVPERPTASPTATATPTATPTPNPTPNPTSTATSTPTFTATTTRLAPRALDIPDPEVDAVEVHVARAEVWRRVVAWIVDCVPFLAAGGALAFLLLREVAAARGGPPRSLEEVLDLVSAERVIALSVAGAVALALATYATLAHALGGATLGKKLVAIRVVGPDGGPPSPARSAIRSLLAVISAGLLGLGFVLALFTRSGRALHDVLARTWVVKAP